MTIVRSSPVGLTGMLAAMFLSTPGQAADADIAVIPKPVKMVVGKGIFELTATTVLTATPGAEAKAKQLADSLRVSTGFSLPLAENRARADYIALELDQSFKARFGAEGYWLSVTPNHVIIRAAAPAGLFHGGVTFRQLLPSCVFSRSVAKQASWTAPCVEIEDQPRFSWRGLLLDPARNFRPPEEIKRFVDLMSLYKLNMLQLHLTDDQGWRIEIKKHSRLTQLGSVRKESPKRGDRKSGDGTPYGPFFYTQAQIRDLVAYAEARHVTIVPEIEMPGHFLAALVAYPQLSCRGGPFEVRTRWGIEHDILCPGNEQSIAFAEDVLAEVIDLFPSQFIHIGGDEAPRNRWKECSKCQARIKAEGLQNESQLQTYFNRRVESFLVSKGRRLIGWDEILEGGLTPGAAVMSWRGMKGGIAAADTGHDVVMSPTSHCYFDYAQDKDASEPEAIGGFLPLATVYAFEPIPESLPDSKKHHILGAQGNLWGEYLRTQAEVDYFAFPRAAALAEVVWSPASQRDFDEFQHRLKRQLTRLDELKVEYRRLLTTTADK